MPGEEDQYPMLLKLRGTAYSMGPEVPRSPDGEAKN